ncbi:MAG TPA: hypothetical protein VFS50_07340 [Meiothermus sp.]|nr:hypothetical protein [Meiothermus sp.]
MNNLFKGDHDLTQLQRALVSFAAGSLPNLAELELYAKAVDNSGGESRSEAVAVKTSNAGAPQLPYLVAFTLPPKPQELSRVSGQGSRVESLLRPRCGSRASYPHRGPV